MRTMQHNSRTNAKGRVHGTKHNDRKFDVSKADNIDQERMKDNIYLNYYGDLGMSFEEVELKFYNENFGKQLERTNENYVANRHPERVKTMEEWKSSKRYCPEETVMQIGKLEEHIDAKTLTKCYNDYNKRLHDWNMEHGRVFTTLNTALHVDEAVPHIQARRVWHYKDASGELRIGQEKALKAAGVELPDPKKAEGRRNNRKMTFDAMARQLWLDVCHEHGLDIEREPLPNSKSKKSMDKADMIREKYQQIIDDTVLIEQELEELKAEVRERKQDIYISNSLSSVEVRKSRLKADEVIMKADDAERLTEAIKQLPAIRDVAIELRQQNRQQEFELSSALMRERIAKKELQQLREERQKAYAAERAQRQIDFLEQYYAFSEWTPDGRHRDFSERLANMVACMITGTGYELPEKVKEDIQKSVEEQVKQFNQQFKAVKKEQNKSRSR